MEHTVVIVLQARQRLNSKKIRASQIVFIKQRVDVGLCKLVFTDEFL